MNVLGDKHVVDGLLAFLEDRRASVGPMPLFKMSASLIGRSGSSAFRLSTTTVSMSLTGSCFSCQQAAVQDADLLAKYPPDNE